MASSRAPSGPPPRCASSTRRRSTGSCGRWSSPGWRARSTSPSWRWRRPASACSRTRCVKNYIATEFLYDYLKDKRTVGVIDEDPAARASSTWPSRLAWCWPCCRSRTRPRRRFSSRSSAAKTRNAMVFRPSARAARCAVRAVEILQRRRRRGGAAAGRSAGHPRPDARRLPVPLPPSGCRLHLDDRGARSAVAAAERRRQAVPQRRARGTRRCTCTAAPTCAWPWSTC